MKFWLDTEFMEDGRVIDLLSIGVVAEDGREFYRQNATADQHKANEFVRNNVLPRLLPCPKGLIPTVHRGAGCGHPECTWRPYHRIANELFRFVHADDLMLTMKPEFWGYYADYDWVAVCQLFGRMVDLPKSWPMYCRDLKQLCDDLGNPELPPEGKGEHNALADARWNKAAGSYLFRLKEEFDLHARWEETRPVDQESGDLRGDPPRSPRARQRGRRKDLQLSAVQGDQEGQA